LDHHRSKFSHTYVPGSKAWDVYLSEDVDQEIQELIVGHMKGLLPIVNAQVHDLGACSAYFTAINSLIVGDVVTCPDSGVQQNE